jgi:DNA polymerase-1
MRLVVIDAANCFYRAFFAIPPLRTSSGFPTNALLGFTNMLRKVIREEQPDGVVIAMDPAGGSFRKELYPEYKANREAQPEDLRAQFSVLRELADALRIPLLEVEGFEADDVIATLASEAPEKSELLIVSTDKDLMQLVSSRVVLLDTMKDRRLGPTEVEERFGVPPERVLDLRALVGDPSDNIPGVRGIGEKGAAKLIAEWTTLEALLEHAEEVKAKKARTALLEQADEARLSKQLATLRTDVPISWDAENFATREPDAPALQELFTRLEFTRLLADFSVGEASPDESAAPAEVTLVSDKRALKKAITALRRARRVALLAVGVEEAGGLPDPPAGIALASEKGDAFYVAALGETRLGLSDLWSALADLLGKKGAPEWIAWNSKTLQTVFAEADCPVAPPTFDVELAAFLLDPAAPRSLRPLAARFLDRRIDGWEELAGKGAKAKSAEELPVDELTKWAGTGALALLEIADAQAPLLARDGLEDLFRDVEMPLAGVLSAMERHGVRIDEEVLARLEKEFDDELGRIEARVFELAGERFSIASPKQLQHILFEKLALPVIRKTKTGYSTDEGVLEQLAQHHELPSYVLAFRRLSKLRSTYVVALPPLVNPHTGRIHPTFHQTGAATGRLSSSHPNVQNIPIRSEDGVRIREAFVPAEGRTLLSADYSQVELRILAHFSGDESLIEAFRSGQDIHRRTAAEVAGIALEEVDAEARARAKAVNFGIIYGLSAFGLANQLGIASAEAQATIDAYFERYEGVRRFIDDTRREAKEVGYVTTLLGRRRYLPDLDSRNRMMRSAAERMAVNTVIQGTAADLIKRAMVSIHRALGGSELDAALILQVHDELVFEVTEAHRADLEALVREHMEGVATLAVPLSVDVGFGASWRAAH